MNKNIYYLGMVSFFTDFGGVLILGVIFYWYGFRKIGKLF